MAKVYSVYANDSEEELVQKLKQALNIPEESRVFKEALHRLDNEQTSKNGNTGLTVEIPTDVRLRSMCKQCFAEAEAEIKQKRLIEASQREEARKRKEFADAMMKGLT